MSSSLKNGIAIIPLRERKKVGHINFDSFSPLSISSTQAVFYILLPPCIKTFCLYISAMWQLPGVYLFRCFHKQILAYIYRFIRIQVYINMCKDISAYHTGIYISFYKVRLYITIPKAFRNHIPRMNRGCSNVVLNVVCDDWMICCNWTWHFERDLYV